MEKKDTTATSKTITDLIVAEISEKAVVVNKHLENLQIAEIDSTEVKKTDILSNAGSVETQMLDMFSLSNDSKNNIIKLFILE